MLSALITEGIVTEAEVRALLRGALQAKLGSTLVIKYADKQRVMKDNAALNQVISECRALLGIDDDGKPNRVLPITRSGY